MVSPRIRCAVQDAHLGGTWSKRLPARCLRRLSTIHYVTAAQGPIQDALLPRRRPLGPETAKQPALVQDRGRVRGFVPEALTCSLAQWEDLVIGWGRIG